MKPVGANERDLKDKAHVLVRKGKLEAAAEVYLQLIAQNNKDPALRLHHAELCEKLNRKDRAVASYQVAAHLLVGSGHTARARAALNAGLRINPEDAGLRRAMRELSPPTQLVLVPKPISYADFELDLVPLDEALTEPHLVAMDENGQSLATVSQRVPTEPAPRTLSASASRTRR